MLTSILFCGSTLLALSREKEERLRVGGMNKLESTKKKWPQFGTSQAWMSARLRLAICIDKKEIPHFISHWTRKIEFDSMLCQMWQKIKPRRNFVMFYPFSFWPRAKSRGFINLMITLISIDFTQFPWS